MGEEEAYIDIQLRGNGLSPKKLANETGLPIESLVESGERSKIGRYKKQPSPYGLGVLSIEPTVHSFDSTINILFDQINIIRENKVENIFIELYNYKASDFLESFYISNEILKKMVLLNAGLLIIARSGKKI